MSSTWVKNINFQSENATEFPLFSKFKHVADIVLTPEELRKKTIIMFKPIIPDTEWKELAQWIYIFTIDDKIVKIGGTRAGLKGRVDSYLCGHHTTDRGKSGKCSVTNAYIYNTFEHYLKEGLTIKMHGFKIPDIKVSMSVWDKECIFSPQTYTIFETNALEIYKQKYGVYPQLSDNSDPSHR